MYQPPQFNKPEHAHALMRAHPLAQLVSTDDAGFPFVTPLPLKLELRGEGAWLLGHVAKPNPHWRYLAQRPEALACFMGPQGYMPASVYPDLQRVPTWNYVALHATVQVTLVHAGDDKDRLLKCLIADHEPAYADQWRSLAESYTTAMLAGIVVFDDTADMVAQARFAFQFCAIESCGKCTPCRLGSTRGLETLDRVIAGDNAADNLALVEDLCDTMKFGSLCALGGFTPYPVLSAIKHFSEDFGER